MELRYARPGDDLQALWKTVFPGDDGALYFEYEYPQAAALVYEQDGRVVSMLHWTNQVMRLWGEDLPCAYILGVGTHPDFRGRGLAGDLVEQALFELHLRRIPLACLIPQEPQLVRFYEKYGFLQTGSRIPARAEPAEAGPCPAADPARLNALYERTMADVPYLKRSPEQWELILREYRVVLTGGGYAVYDDGAWMEGSRGAPKAGAPDAGMVKVIESRALTALARTKGKAVPEGVCDEYCPWNGTDESAEGGPSLERLWFSADPPYINLLHNGRSEIKW